MSRVSSDEIDAIAGLQTDEQRLAYIDTHPELVEPDCAKHLCRAVAETAARDLRLSEGICLLLDRLATLNPDPTVTAYKHHAWGVHLNRAGRDQRRAVAHWKAALSGFLAEGREEDAAITALCALNDLHSTGEMTLLRSYEQLARAHFEEKRDRLRLGLLKANLATLHAHEGRWGAAAAGWEEAYQDLFPTHVASRHLITILGNLSAAYLHLDDVPRAARFLERARLLSEEIGATLEFHHIDENLAMVRYLQGDFSSALELTTSVRAHTQHIASPLYYQATLDEAEVLVSLCAADTAQVLANEAFDGFSRLGLGQGQAQALMTLARCALAHSMPRRALSLYRQARSLLKARPDEHTSHLCEIGVALARFEIGDSNRALALICQVLETTSQRPKSSLHLRSRLLSARILISLGDFEAAREHLLAAIPPISLLDQGPLEAEALLLLASLEEHSGNLAEAYAAYRRADQLVSRTRRLYTPGELRLRYLEDKVQLYESLFELELQLGRPATKALTWAERAKSPTLAERLAERFRPAHAAAEASAKPTAPAYSPPDDSQLAASLPADTTLVEYYFSRSYVYALVGEPGNLRAFRLGSVATMERAQRVLTFELNRVAASSPQDRSASELLLDHLRALYRLLWLPLAPYVGTPRVLVVPHGFLHQTPFHALLDGDEYLVDRHSFSYCPSATVFYMTRTAPPITTPEKSLVVGISDPATPAVQDEVATVAARLPNALLVAGDRATRDTIVAHLASAHFIHIASHAAFSPSFPTASFIGTGSITLTAEDLQGMSLGAKLVTLSGCDTGRATTSGGDEIMGLSRALLQAGARSALLSLWKLADESAARFMETLYRHICETVALDVALRRTMLQHRDSHPSPHLWAPFAAIGDPQAVAR